MGKSAEQSSSSTPSCALCYSLQPWVVVLWNSKQDCSKIGSPDKERDSLIEEEDFSSELWTVCNNATVPEILSLELECSTGQGAITAGDPCCHSGLLWASSFNLCICLRSAGHGKTKVYHNIHTQRNVVKLSNWLLLGKSLRVTVGHTDEISCTVFEWGSTAASTPRLMPLHVGLQLGLVTLPLLPLYSFPLLLLLNLQNKQCFFHQMKTPQPYLCSNQWFFND